MIAPPPVKNSRNSIDCGITDTNNVIETLLKVYAELHKMSAPWACYEYAYNTAKEDAQRRYQQLDIEFKESKTNRTCGDIVTDWCAQLFIIQRPNKSREN